MSLLAPWFLAGLALLAGPVIAHLIRRASRDRVSFSALRFLEASAPRLDRRSRVQHPWLLVLRCLIVALLALAFARPYLRSSAAPVAEVRPPRQLVVILDQSASMQRPGLWPAAMARVQRLGQGLAPQDQFVLLTAGVGVHEAISAARWQQTPVSERSGLLRGVIDESQPGWGPTPLDTALETALAQGEQLAEATGGGSTLEIVIVSDFTASARLSGVANLSWSARAVVSFEPVQPEQAGNAALHGLGWTSLEDGTPAARIRVSRTFDAPEQLRWQVRDALTGEIRHPPEELTVGPGATEVLTVPWPSDGREALVVELEGDAAAFDNRWYAVRPTDRHLAVHYLGAAADDDTAQSHFYLTRAFTGAEDPTVSLNAGLGDLAAARVLYVIDQPLDTATTATLRRRVSEGSTALLLAHSDALVAQAAALAEETGWSAGVPTRADALLGHIDFRHPLFAPFADPRFSDFTRIRFWEPRPLQLPAASMAEVAARFDDGQPAVVEVPVGRGRLVVWGGAWTPAASQWVLSSKFVPWLQALAQRAAGGATRASTGEIGDHARLLSAATSQLEQVTARDGNAAGAAGPAQPGLYREVGDTPSRLIALNVPVAESRLDPLPLDTWEQLGVPLATSATTSAGTSPTRASAQNAIALEGGQQGWRSLIWLVVLLLGVESLVARLLVTSTGPRPVAP